MLFYKNKPRKPHWPYSLNLDCQQGQGVIGLFTGGPSAYTPLLLDLSTARNNGSLTGGTASQNAACWTGGLDGGRAVKTASSIYGAVTIPQVSSLSAVSIGGWVYRSASGTMSAFGMDNGGNRFTILWYTSDQFIVYYGSGTSLAGPTISKTGWYRLDADFLANSGVRLYINGVLAASVAVGAVTISDSTYMIGRNATLGFAPGIYDSCIVYKRSRTAQEIWTCYDPRTRWDIRNKQGGKTFFFMATTLQNQGIIGAFNRRVLGG